MDCDLFVFAPLRLCGTLKQTNKPLNTCIDVRREQVILLVVEPTCVVVGYGGRLNCDGDQPGRGVSERCSRGGKLGGDQRGANTGKIPADIAVSPSFSVSLY